MTDDLTRRTQEHLAKHARAKGYNSVAEWYLAGDADDNDYAFLAVKELLTPMTDEKALERAREVVAQMYEGEGSPSTAAEIRQGKYDRWQWRSVQASKTALLTYHDFRFKPEPEPKDEDVEMLRSRIGQSFLGKCHLAVEEAERIIARLEEQGK